MEDPSPREVHLKINAVLPLPGQSRLRQWSPLSPSFSPFPLNILDSLSQKGTHQIEIVDLLILGSASHRQQFHTQDGREMNSEDARGDMEPWPPQWMPLWPLYQARLGRTGYIEREWYRSTHLRNWHPTAVWSRKKTLEGQGTDLQSLLLTNWPQRWKATNSTYHSQSLIES